MFQVKRNEKLTGVECSMLFRTAEHGVGNQMTGSFSIAQSTLFSVSLCESRFRYKRVTSVMRSNYKQ